MDVKPLQGPHGRFGADGPSLRTVLIIQRDSASSKASLS